MLISACCKRYLALPEDAFAKLVSLDLDFVCEALAVFVC